MGRLSTEIGEVNEKGSWIPEDDLVLASHHQKPGLGSPVSMAPVPLLSSSLMSLKPPRGWSQSTSHQQMFHANNHQLRTQTAPQINGASTCSSTDVPYVFNIDNVALWLKNWNSETINSKPENVGVGNQPPPPPPPPVGLDVFGGEQEDFLPSPEVATASSSGWQKMTVFRR